MTKLELLAKISIGYFIIFNVIYFVKFVQAFLLFEKFHSTPTGVNIAQTIIGGSSIFIAAALLAVVGAGIWIYQTVWEDNPTTVS